MGAAPRGCARGPPLPGSRGAPGRRVLRFIACRVAARPCRGVRVREGQIAGLIKRDKLRPGSPAAPGRSEAKRVLWQSGTEPRCAVLGGGHGSVSHPAPAMDAGWVQSGGRGLVWLPMRWVWLCPSAEQGPGCGFRSRRRSCKCRTCRPARCERGRSGAERSRAELRGSAARKRRPPVRRAAGAELCENRPRS